MRTVEGSRKLPDREGLKDGGDILPCCPVSSSRRYKSASSLFLPARAEHESWGTPTALVATMRSSCSRDLGTELKSRGKLCNLYCTRMQNRDQQAHSKASLTAATAREDNKCGGRGHGERWWWSGASPSARRPPGAIIRRQFPTALVPHLHVVPRPSSPSPSTGSAGTS